MIISEKRYEKYRGMDKVEETLNSNLATVISPDKLAVMKFSVILEVI